MNASDPVPVLRPLGLGEVLDRAVTLCVRNFLPLSLIYLVYAIPLAVVQFYATKDYARLFETITTTVAAGGGRSLDAQAISRALASVHPNGIYGSFLGIVFALGPLPTAALISATSSRYLGRAGSFSDAYRVALRRWLPLVGINFLYVLALIVLYVALVVAVIAVFLAVHAVAQASHTFGIASGIVIGLLAFVLTIAFAVVASLAFQISYFTCVVENEGVFRAFSRGISRVFSGIGLKRSLLAGIVFLAIGLGITFVSAVGEAVLVGAVHSAFAGTIYTTLVRIATAAFATAFIAIFYFDLRVREEGLDLQMAAERISHPLSTA